MQVSTTLTGNEAKHRASGALDLGVIANTLSPYALRSDTLSDTPMRPASAIVAAGPGLWYRDPQETHGDASQAGV
jgi:hypothetical protein